MPTYFAAGISANLVVCELATSTTANISKRKSDVSKAATDAAESAFDSGQVLKETDLNGQGGKPQLRFLAEKPFLMVKVGQGLFNDSSLNRIGPRRENHRHSLTSLPDAFSPTPAASIAHVSTNLRLGLKDEAHGHDSDRCISNGNATPSDKRYRPHSDSDASDTQQSNIPSTLNGSLDPSPHALGLRMKLSKKTFLKAFDANETPQDVKIDVFFNGSLTESTMINARDSKYVETGWRYFTGRRIAFLVERPWVIVPPGRQADGSLRSLKRGKSGEPDSITERWRNIGIGLLKEANSMGFNSEGERPPVGTYLEALSEIEIPGTFEEFQGPTGAKFGVIDVVVSVGIGSKRIGSSSYITLPTPLKDDRYNPTSSSVKLVRLRKSGNDLESDEASKQENLKELLSMKKKRGEEHVEIARSLNPETTEREHTPKMKGGKLTTKDTSSISEQLRLEPTENAYPKVASETSLDLGKPCSLKAEKFEFSELEADLSLPGGFSDSGDHGGASSCCFQVTCSTPSRTLSVEKHGKPRSMITDPCDTIKSLTERIHASNTNSSKKRKRPSRPSDCVLSLDSSQLRTNGRDNYALSWRGVFVSPESPAAISQVRKLCADEKRFEIFEAPPSRIYPGQPQTGAIINSIVITLGRRSVRRLDLPVPRRILERKMLGLPSLLYRRQRSEQKQDSTIAPVIESEVNSAQFSGLSELIVADHPNSVSNEGITRHILKDESNPSVIPDTVQSMAAPLRSRGACRGVNQGGKVCIAPITSPPEEGTQSEFEVLRKRRKRRSNAKKRKKPSSIIQSEPTMEVPELSRDCVITYAEPQAGGDVVLGPKGIVRQIRCQRPGDFRESDVVIGIRFLVIT